MSAYNLLPRKLLIISTIIFDEYELCANSSKPRVYTTHETPSSVDQIDLYLLG